MQHAVVLDDYYSQLLISVAFQERLLFDDEKNSDGIFERFKNQKIPNVFKSALLENLTLSGHFVANIAGSDYLRGSLIDDNVVSFRDKISTSSPDDESPVFSIDLLVPFLAAKGIITDLDSISTRLQQAAETEGELKTRFGEIPRSIQSDGVPLSEAISRIVSHVNFVPQYTEDEYRRLAEWRKTRDDLNPIVDAINELISVEVTARQISAYRLFRINPTIAHSNSFKTDYFGPDLRITSASPDMNELHLFKIACGHLGKLPARPTLRETIDLAQRAETEALRDQIEGWTSALAKGDLEDERLISRDIARSTKWLREADQVSRAFEIFTVVGFPLAVAALLGEGDIAAGLTAGGLVLSGLGAVATIGINAVKRKDHWVMFGS